MDDSTAYHEAGHAVVATLQGGIVGQITIEPDGDDRFGDTEVAWPMGSCTPKQHALREIKTLMAGSIVERTFAGEEDVFSVTAESSADWLRAFQLAAEVEADPMKQSLLLAKAAQEVKKTVSDEGIWAAICALADELEAHETLEAEAVKEVLGFWLGRLA